MPELRIWWHWQSEPRLGRPALDLASSRPLPLPPVPCEISRLVLESVTCGFALEPIHFYGSRFTASRTDRQRAAYDHRR